MPKFKKRPEDRLYKTPTSLEKFLQLIDPNEGSKIKQILSQSALDQSVIGSGVNMFNTFKGLSKKDRSLNGYDVLEGGLELAKVPSIAIGDILINTLQEGVADMADFEGNRKPFKTPIVPTQDNTRVTGMKMKKYAFGTAEDPTLAALAKVITERNKNLPWVDRGLNPQNYPVSNQQDFMDGKNIMSHKLSWSQNEDNTEFYVQPEINYNNGNLEWNNKQQPIKFNNKQMAIYS